MSEDSRVAKPGGQSAAPTMSVVIPSYRRPGDLRRCLAALIAQTRAADEVVVVHRHGDSGTRAVVSEFESAIKGLRSGYVSEPGLIAAINRGLDCAAGDFIVLTDDDTEAFPDWLQRIEAAFLSDSAIAAVGGRDWIQLPGFCDPPTVDRVGVVRWWGKYCGNHHCFVRDHVQKVEFLKGANFSIRKSALGPYRIDTSLRGKGAQVGTEMDLCMHLKGKGFDVVFDDRILVKHYGSPRPDEQGNTAPEKEERHQFELFPDIRYNNQYMAAKHWHLLFSLASLGNGLLAGSYLTPGLLAGVKFTMKGNTAIWRHFILQSRCALAGHWAGRSARRALRAAHRGRP